MGRMTLFSALSLAISSFAANADTLFTALPDAKYPEEKIIHFTPVQFITGLEGEQYTLLPLSGRLTRQGYDLAEGYTPELAIDNYLAQLKKLQADILFQCQGQSCGDVAAMQRQLSPVKASSAMDYCALVVAKLKAADKEVYTSIFAASGAGGGIAYVGVDTLQPMAEPLDLVQVNGDFLQEVPMEMEFKDRHDKDVDGSADHPLLGRLPGSYISSYRQVNLTQVPAVVGITGDKYQTQPLDAKLTEITYRFWDDHKGYSLFEINSNYAAAARKLGATEVFHCKAEACGDDDKFIAALALHDSGSGGKQQEYHLYKLSRAQGDVYFDTYTQGKYDGSPDDTVVRVMELGALNDNRVVINLDALTDAIAQSGKATLDGLLFDYDSDRIQPQSKAVMAVLANYLKQHSKQGFYVVGHTDDQGERSYNQSLSERRAAAVIKELSETYQVPASQLTAYGNGEYSPIASNENEAGRSLNRRVELVLRSDKK